MTTNYDSITYRTDAKQSKLEKIFTEFFVFNKNIPTDSSNPWHPPTDVYETPDEIVVKMSLSGTKSDDIQVAFSDEILTISGYRNGTLRPTKRPVFIRWKFVMDTLKGVSLFPNLSIRTIFKPLIRMGFSWLFCPRQNSSQQKRFR